AAGDLHRPGGTAGVCAPARASWETAVAAGSTLALRRDAYRLVTLRRDDAGAVDGHGTCGARPAPVAPSYTYINAVTPFAAITTQTQGSDTVSVGAIGRDGATAIGRLVTGLDRHGTCGAPPASAAPLLFAHYPRAIRATTSSAPGTAHKDSVSVLARGDDFLV